MGMSGLAFAILFLAQEGPKVGPGAEVRAMSFAVLDEKGAAVEGLGLEDVALLENGVARPITSFRPDSRPLTVALVLDTSLAVGSSYRLNVVEAVTQFVARLPEGARYGVWTTGDRPTKVLDYTDDRGAATKALTRVAPQGGNYMLDGVAEAAADLRKVAREGDRTVVVAVSATGTEFSYRDRYRAAEEAERNLDLLLAVQMEEGESTFEERTNLNYVLDHVARTTGGVYDIILSPLGLDSALRKLSPVLRAQYRLAYATVPEIKNRKLEVTVARPGSRVLLPRRSPEGP